MGEPVSTIRNLGPASDRAYARAGIHSADEIRQIGPDAAYLRLIKSGERPHFIGYYCLVLGLQGRPWNNSHGKEKLALRTRFDAIKALAASAPTPTSRLDADLDAIGLRTPQPKA